MSRLTAFLIEKFKAQFFNGGTVRNAVYIRAIHTPFDMNVLEQYTHTEQFTYNTQSKQNKALSETRKLVTFVR